jgi:hypothetical protein
MQMNFIFTQGTRTSEDEKPKEKEVRKETHDEEEVWLGMGNIGVELASRLDRDGYLLLHGFIEEETCQAVIEEGFQRMNQLFGLRKEDRSTWKCIPRHGCVDIWHLPSLYVLRQHPRLYAIFAQILKTPNLAVSIDRICMKPPRASASAEASEPTTASFPSDGVRYVQSSDGTGGIEVEFEIDLNQDYGNRDTSETPASQETVMSLRTEEISSSSSNNLEEGPWPLPQLHTDWNFWHSSEDFPEFQCGICLSDCPIGGGGFFCIPGRLWKKYWEVD